MNIKRLFTIGLIAIIGSLSFANAAQDLRDLSAFSKIKVCQGVKVVYTQDSKQKVLVTAKENKVFEDVVTSVNGETLEISLKAAHNQTRNSDIIVYVSAPLLDEVYTMNYASFEAKSMKGLAKLKVIQAKESFINIGELEVENGLELIVTGKSHFGVKKLLAEDLNLTMRNNSRAIINNVAVANEIKIRSNGKSYASFGGEAHNIFIEKSCCTSVDVRNLTYDSITTSEINII